jgi:hypothetical protein
MDLELFQYFSKRAICSLYTYFSIEKDYCFFVDSSLNNIFSEKLSNNHPSLFIERKKISPITYYLKRKIPFIVESDHITFYDSKFSKNFYFIPLSLSKNISNLTSSLNSLPLSPFNSFKLTEEERVAVKNIEKEYKDKLKINLKEGVLTITPAEYLQDSFIFEITIKTTLKDGEYIVNNKLLSDLLIFENISTDDENKFLIFMDTDKKKKSYLKLIKKTKIEFFSSYSDLDFLK